MISAEDMLTNYSALFTKHVIVSILNFLVLLCIKIIKKKKKLFRRGEKTMLYNRYSSLGTKDYLC